MSTQKQRKKNLGEFYIGLYGFSEKYDKIIESFEKESLTKVNGKVDLNWESEPVELNFEKDPKTLRFEIVEVTSYEVEDVDSEAYCTSLAIKDHYSFMISTSDYQIRVIENGSQIFGGYCGSSGRYVNDMIYCGKIDSYLIYHDLKIYKKYIDNKPLSLFLDLKSGIRIGASFRYSNIHGKLIIAKNGSCLSCIQLKTKEIEIEIPKSKGRLIRDFELFGDNEDKVVSLTQDGYLFASKFDFSLKKGRVISIKSIKFIKNRGEEARKVVRCPQNKYFFVEIYRRKRPMLLCSRMMIFLLKKEKFHSQAVIDQFDHNFVGCKAAMSCLGYFKNTIVFMGLSLMEGGYSQLYCYNTDTNDFEEIEKARIEHQEWSPFKMVKVGNSFFYTGHLGKLMKLTVKSNGD